MAIISNSITFTVGDAAPVATTQSDILLGTAAPSILLPGDPIGVPAGQLRRLVYPDATFAPLIYETNPDVYTNFNTSPLDQRPRALTTGTLEDNVIMGWLGKGKDVAIAERWVGSTTRSRMTLTFFTELQNYYRNPPTNGTFITWEPRDRSSKTYKIVIESFTLSLTGSAGAGAGDYEFDYIVTRHGYVAGTVELRFRIIGEA